MGLLVLIRGAGDLASGIALRLHRARFSVVMTDLPHPTAIRRTVCFSEALRLGRTFVEDVEGVRVSTLEEIDAALKNGTVPVAADPHLELLGSLNPEALVDAIIAKRNLGTKITFAPIVVGVGPGFTAGEDCGAVVETKRGHNLGRVLTRGSAAPNTGTPGNIGGYTKERVLRAPCDGVFLPLREIGDTVTAGDIAGEVNGKPVICAIDGVLRGILPEGTRVNEGMKSGDIDPRGEKSHCFTVSDKALSVGGGVLEAILSLKNG